MAHRARGVVAQPWAPLLRMFVGMFVAAGIGGVTFLGAGVGASVVAGASTAVAAGPSPGAGANARTTAPPVIRNVPAGILTSAGRRASSSTTTTSPGPCWASGNWSGYAVSETSPSGLPCVPGSGQAYTAVTGTWTVPTVSASRGAAYSAAWAGIDGFTDGNLIQAGTEQDGVGGSGRYAAWWEVLPAPETVIPSITVEPGDAVTVSITEVSTSQWQITLTDAGQPGHPAQPPFTTTQAYSGPGTSAEWVLEAPEVNGRTATLAQYGSANFDLAAVDGQSPGLTAGSGGEMVQRGFFRTQVASTPSGPDTGSPAGDGFAVAYGSTAPPAPAS